MSTIVDVIVPNVPIAEEVNSFKGIPLGGTIGQVLTKVSSDPYDTLWQNPTGGGNPTPVHSIIDITWGIGGLATGTLYADVTKFGQLVVFSYSIGVDIGSVGTGNSGEIYALPSGLTPINYSTDLFIQPFSAPNELDSWPAELIIARTSDYGSNSILFQFYGNVTPLLSQKNYTGVISWFVAP